MPLLRKFSGPSFGERGASNFAHLLLLRLPHVEGRNHRGSGIHPLKSPPASRHERSSQGRERGSIGRGSESLAVRNLEPVPVDGVRPCQGCQEDGKSLRFLTPAKVFSPDRSKALPNCEFQSPPRTQAK